MEVAALRGSFDVGKLLVQKSRPMDGALGYAVERGALDIARFLIESGASVNACHSEMEELGGDILV
jgi:ankyrin repeat protein